MIFSRSGHPVPVLNQIPLHSKIVREKEGFLKSEEQGRPLLVIGLGFGYHLPDQNFSSAPLLVMEPDENLCLAFREHRPELNPEIFSGTPEEIMATTDPIINDFISYNRF